MAPRAWRSLIRLRQRKRRHLPPKNRRRGKFSSVRTSRTCTTSCHWRPEQSENNPPDPDAPPRLSSIPKTAGTKAAQGSLHSRFAPRPPAAATRAPAAPAAAPPCFFSFVNLRSKHFFDILLYCGRKLRSTCALLHAGMNQNTGPPFGLGPWQMRHRAAARPPVWLVVTAFALLFVTAPDTERFFRNNFFSWNNLWGKLRNRA